MFLRTLFLALSLIFTCIALTAQYDPSESSPPNRSSAHFPEFVPAPVTIKFSLEDGALITAAPSVRSTCRSIGLFWKGSTGVIKLQDVPGPAEQAPGPPRAPQCMVRISLAGYRTMFVVADRDSAVVLSRLGENEGSLVSVTTLQAPPEAQKLYAKGERLMTKRKWVEAEDQFRKAVALYAPYAPAWSELGTALQEQGQFDAARAALDRASTADPRYVKPLIQMAELDGRSERWDQEVSDAQRAIELTKAENPASAFYYYAEAKYHLNDLPAAEEWCRKAANSDLMDTIPDVYFLMGNILAAEGRTPEAVQYFRLYERIHRHGRYLEEAKRRIRELK